jgi:hypothetical protein
MKLNNTNIASEEHAPEFDPVVDLLQADAMLNAGAADSALEARIASATVRDLKTVQHAPVLRLTGEDAASINTHRRHRWAGGLRLAAAVAFIATLAASFLAVRGPTSSSTSGVTVANAAMPTVIEDWDILLGGESTSIASSSESLLKDSETIGKRWSSEYSETDWTLVEEGSM